MTKWTVPADQIKPKTQWFNHTLRKSGKTIKVKVVTRSTIAKILTMGKTAITIWNRIYIRPPFYSPTLLKHELVHVDQWHEQGPLTFGFHYLRLLISKGYDKHPYEQEARRISGEGER